jgi:hypothetical protein
MNLLEDIQQAAVDSSVDLSTLLRKCKLLAARIESMELEDWVSWESNGYPEEIAVPSYRVWPVEVKGNFAGPFGSSSRHIPVPSIALPEAIREHYQAYECRQSVAAIEETVRKADAIVTLVHGDLALIVGENVLVGQTCIQAWGEFSTLNLSELLNSVRNRVLDLALAVWKEAPDAGESSGVSPLPDGSHANQIINTMVYGGSPTVVGVAGSVAVNVIRGDFESLRRFLVDAGLSEDDVRLLDAAVHEDSQPDSAGRYGERVSGWFGKMLEKAMSGAWNIAANVASGLLTQALAKYYGRV